ncbi:Ig-like domain-containing protein, partial [Enterovirga sp. CN4-39]|uniref:cadherin repeat domain-containing protein n=1 Tax=Enterovirga sp. CN4-39 TaxID=3400910 RepID=UPI003C04273C
MAIQFTSPASVSVPEGGTPNLKISAINTNSSNMPVNIVLSGDVDLFRHSGLDHFLGDGEASQYFPNGVDYDRPVKTVYELTAHAVSEWYDDEGYHREEATQTFQLNITDLPIPDHSDFESPSSFSIRETSGESRVLQSSSWELSAFGATHTSPASETQNSGPLQFTLVDDDGGNFESFVGGGYSDPYYNPTGFWIRTKAGASIQVGEDGTAQRHIKVQITDGTNYDVVDMTINVENVLPTAPVDADPTGNGTQSGNVLSGFVLENAAAGTAVGLTARSNDPGNTPLRYYFANGTQELLVDQATGFTIDPETGVVRVGNGRALDFETTPQIFLQIGATDGRPGSYAVTTFGIGIGDVNEAPVFDQSLLSGTPNFFVNENTIAVGDIGYLVTDPDGPATQPTFSITGGADAARFTISPAGEIAFAAAPDFDAPGDADGNNLYEIEVTAADPLGAAASTLLTIRVDNVNEAPTITNRTFTVASGATTIGTIGAVDPDAGDTLRFSFVPDDYESQGKFLLDGLTGAIRFSSPRAYDSNNHTITAPIVVTDAAGRSDTQTVTVEILPPPAPTDTTPPAFSSASISGPTLLLTYD